MKQESTFIENHWAIDKEHNHISAFLPNPTLKSRVVNHLIEQIGNEKGKRFSISNSNEATQEVSNLSLDSIELPDFKPHYLINDDKICNYEMQQWVGHVVEIKDDVFVAKLDDLYLNTTHEIAEFEINEVSPGDKELLKLGASFYFSLGYQLKSGQVRKMSLLRFRRAKLWDESFVEKIESKIETVLSRITFE